MRVARRNGRHVVAMVRQTARAQAVPAGGDLVFHLGGREKGRLDLASLPAEVTPIGGDAPFGAGRERFGPVAHNPADPNQIAFGVNGLHAILATTTLPGDADPDVRPINLYFEGKVTNLIWLPEGCSSRLR